MSIIRDTIENQRATTPTKVGDATLANEAVSKGQMDLKQDIATAITTTNITSQSVANATKWNGSTQSTSTAAASGGVDGDIWFQY